MDIPTKMILYDEDDSNFESLLFKSNSVISWFPIESTQNLGTQIPKYHLPSVL